MSDFDISFGSNQFKVIVSLGNTLVHLLSGDINNDFFRKISIILSKNGLFIFQILNYQKILTARTTELPLIENDKITFMRHYDHETHKPLLVFKTSLRVKETSEIINNLIDLYPLRKTELMNMSSRHLFRSIRFCGGFDGRVFSREDDLLIGLWEK